MEETIEMLIKRISDLEERVERYYEELKVENELDFILKGNYYTKAELEQAIVGDSE